MSNTSLIDTPFETVDIYNNDEYSEIPWKNGLGTTFDILIEPSTVDFTSENFLWKLTRESLEGGCKLSMYPNYSVSLFLLSESTECILHHDDKADDIVVPHLGEYQYNGSISTTCTMSGPGSVLMLVNDKKRTKVSTQIKKISNFEQFLTTELASTSNNDIRLLMYVIKGSVQVSLDTDDECYVLEQHSTLHYKKISDPKGPKITDFTLVPMNLKGEVLDNGLGEATVLFIQIEYLPPSISSANIKESPLLAHSDPVGLPPLIGGDGMNPKFWNIPLLQRHGSKIVNGPIGGLERTESSRHYKPPESAQRDINESDVPPAIIKDYLDIEDYPLGSISTAWINIIKQGLSEWIRIPVIICRGAEPGPVLGVTAVVHGNELNGVPCIHKVVGNIDVALLKGTLVAVPCVNVPGYLKFSREFSDGKDLNRYFPGSPTGTSSQIFNYNFFTKIVKTFNFMIDLHTASFGRINSYYIRADLNDETSAIFAKLQQPQIILHNSGQDGTLRSAAANIGIKSITVEIGNPSIFQSQFVEWSYIGVMRVLTYLNMFREITMDLSPSPAPLTVLCSKGYWIYTKTGGVLEVYPKVNSIIKKGALIARIKNIFGNIVDEIYCPENGVNIGKSSNPVAMSGDRIIHLGIIKKSNEELAAEAKENY